MGHAATGDRKYAIQSMWDCHREVLRLAVQGLKQVDIAEALGVTPVMVSYTLNSPIAKREIENLRAARDLDAVDVAKRIQEIAPIALQTLETLLCEGNETTRYKTATDLLDRAGHAAIRTLRTESLSVHLTKDDIDEIKNRAKEIGLCVIEATDCQHEVLGVELPTQRVACSTPMEVQSGSTPA
jgi:predicted transcriptional regulator